MKVGSLFSGCGLADYGLHQAGFELAWACEIEKQPRAVLRRHFPKAEIHFDVKEMTGGTLEPVELLFFGSPCQDLSVAGKRAGLAGERSGLFTEAMRIVDEMDAPPRICVWENVCGALSSNKGADFATVLTEMGKRWSGVAYRVLDLQWFGVPQRRRRVFVVGHSGGWRSAAEILFEREGLRRNPPTRRKAGQGVATTVGGGIEGGCRGHGARSGDSKDELIVPVIANSLRAQPNPSHRLDTDTYIPHRMVKFGEYVADGSASKLKRRDYKDATDLVVSTAVIYQDSEFGCQGYETAGSMRAGRIPEHQMVLEPVCFHPTQDPITSTDGTTHALGCGSSGGQASAAVAFQPGNLVRQAGANPSAHVFPCIPSSIGDGRGGSDQSLHVAHAMQVRRLTPTECERLMGAPDGYTAWGIDDNVKRVEMADGPRYKMIGNGVGVPHSRWIGNRALASLKQ